MEIIGYVLGVAASLWIGRLLGYSAGYGAGWRDGLRRGWTL